MIDESILKKCGEAIRRVDPSAEVILYGSRARGDHRDDSDYDFLIIVDGEVAADKEDIIREQLYPVELDTGCVLTVFMISRSEWNSPLYIAMPFYQNVRREGITL